MSGRTNSPAPRPIATSLSATAPASASRSSSARSKARRARMREEASADTPRTLPRTEETLEDYLAFFRAPDIREDRVWIARVADDVVGISVLSYPPVRGPVGTAWTATARSVRGRGVARAL